MPPFPRPRQPSVQVAKPVVIQASFPAGIFPEHRARGASAVPSPAPVLTLLQPRLAGAPGALRMPAFGPRSPTARSFATAKVRSFAVPNSLLTYQAAGTPVALPLAIQRRVEQLLEADFSDVRVRVGPASASIGASAFSAGSTLHFAPSRFQPLTPEGQRLIARELVHIQQQRAGRVIAPRDAACVVVYDPALEDEADRIAAQALQPAALKGAASTVPMPRNRVAMASTRPAVVQPMKQEVPKELKNEERKESRKKKRGEKPDPLEGDILYAPNASKLNRENNYWSPDVFYEVANETLMLAILKKEHQSKVREYWDAATAAVRHKLSWQYCAAAVGWAREDESHAPLNNVLVLAARLDLPRIADYERECVGWGDEEWTSWIDDVANGTPNVFWGDAGVNSAIQERLDFHYWSDPFGASFTPQGPASPVSKGIEAVALDLKFYLNGHLCFTSKEVQNRFDAVRKHYKKLRKLAQDLHQQKLIKKSVFRFFEDREREVGGPHHTWTHRGKFLATDE